MPGWPPARQPPALTLPTCSHGPDGQETRLATLGARHADGWRGLDGGRARRPGCCAEDRMLAWAGPRREFTSVRMSVVLRAGPMVAAAPPATSMPGSLSGEDVHDGACARLLRALAARLQPSRPVFQGGNPRVLPALHNGRHQPTRRSFLHTPRSAACRVRQAFDAQLAPCSTTASVDAADVFARPRWPRHSAGHTRCATRRSLARPGCGTSPPPPLSW
jgi:hypothetical protein